ncbi:hypothetical protein PBAL39_22515 [Pedobacter sp. BAL39]|uniref:hypothetical protein n=1 Tax=Pedobacter sp. BAL39 TaxID=391596 RepID=UPI00015597A2|nr:hypothetical protein [Pedobacter sp. BAL39]EDM38894.1 hypothetical protein PBAL39_22515 [Pedobacter sp. BAL39]
MRAFKLLLTVLLLIVLLIYSCNLLKNVSTDKSLNRSNSKSSSEYVLSSDFDRERNIDFFSYRKDSGNQQYQVTLWPKGRFSFSQDSGFRGEADRIDIKGTASSLRTATARMKGDEKLKVQEELTTRNQQKLAEEQSHKQKITSVSWKLLLMVVLGILVLLFWLYRKIKRKS